MQNLIDLIERCIIDLYFMSVLPIHTKLMRYCNYIPRFIEVFNTYSFWYDLNPTMYLVYFGGKDILVERTRVMEMMSNASFNNISVISLRSVVLGRWWI